MVRVISGVSGVLRFLPRAIIVLALIAVLRPTAAQAQTCGTEYTIKEGETLAQIAARVYGNPA
jgi:nucleoid-associated protein YgaU